jgi:hypothetical protein
MPSLRSRGPNHRGGGPALPLFGIPFLRAGEKPPCVGFRPLFTRIGEVALQRLPKADVTKARHVCQMCPFISPCREWAIGNNESWGMWGGMTKRQREYEIRRRKKEQESMAEQRCELTELLIDQCGCPTHRGAADPEAAPIGGTFAKFPGKCAECQESINPGDRISLQSWDGRTQRWVHGECG